MKVEKIIKGLEKDDKFLSKLDINILDKLINNDTINKDLTLKYNTGKVSITSNGNAYINGDEIFIKNINLNKSLDNDIVEYIIFKKNINKSEAIVTKVLERSNQNYVGILRKDEKYSFIETQKKNIYTDIYIKNDSSNIDIENGSLVLFNIDKWIDTKSPYGKILKSIGKPYNNDSETESILIQYNLPFEFSDEIKNYIDNIDINISDLDLVDREDFRDILTFTIDPFNAKDFDDAISFKSLDNGNLEVGIHIADVSHYVKPYDIIDNEANIRGNSVYLVDRVIPMLPELLSDYVCSLRPNEEKLTFSFIFEFDNEFNIKKERFVKGIINSNYRFSYEEAQYIIENPNIYEIPNDITIDNNIKLIDDSVSKSICLLNKLSKKLRNDRSINKSIFFDKEEVKFKLDDDGNPIDVYVKKMKDSNKLIEELMLLTNRRVGDYMKKNKKDFIYRIHEEPDLEKIMDLNNNLINYGYSIDVNNIKESINNLIIELKEKNESNILNTLIIKCMKKAEYSTEYKGHYGLSFENYSHMTSPIRRYSDLIAHRLLHNMILKENEKYNKIDLGRICGVINSTEKNATMAERDSIKYMQIKYLSDKIGNIFKGIISGIKDKNIFIELIDSKSDGILENNKNINIFDNYIIINGIKYNIGDEIIVVLKKIDKVKRKIILNNI